MNTKISLTTSALAFIMLAIPGIASAQMIPASARCSSDKLGGVVADYEQSTTLPTRDCWQKTEKPYGQW